MRTRCERREDTVRAFSVDEKPVRDKEGFAVKIKEYLLRRIKPNIKKNILFENTGA